MGAGAQRLNLVLVSVWSQEKKLSKMAGLSFCWSVNVHTDGVRVSNSLTIQYVS